MTRTLRFLLAAAVVAAALTLMLAGCGKGASSADEEAAKPGPLVPAAYKELRAVYSLTGSSFYATSFTDGEQRLLFNAEGDVNAATFATWVPERSELVYEAIQETGRELWVYREETGKQERLSQNLDAVIGVRGGREVLFGADGMEGPGLRSYDLQTGESKMLLPGTVSAIPGKGLRAPLCFARRSSSGKQELYVVEDTGEPVLVATLPAGRQSSKAVVLEDALVCSVLLPGAGEYGEVTRWDRQSGRPTVVAQEAKLLDVASDGGLLVQKHLRGGVSGVTRSLLSYVPSGKAAATRQPLDLGAYAGTVHAAAFVGDEGSALISQRLESVNVLELYSLESGEAAVLGRDPDYQVTRIEPLGTDAIAAVRIRPGMASGGGEGDAPSISSLEDEIVWIPLSEEAEEVSVVSTPAGPIGLLGVFEPR